MTFSLAVEIWNLNLLKRAYGQHSSSLQAEFSDPLLRTFYPLQNKYENNQGHIIRSPKTLICIKLECIATGAERQTHVTNADAAIDSKSRGNVLIECGEVSACFLVA